ncbi:MAG: energy-coupling factor transporter ATPase [Ruminococcaceae bacterium]|nr:energy-coupling factor transporter ATPase [Oscillospiraceae bacterium]
MSEAFIKIENLSYAYSEDEGRSVPVLRDVSLEIERGEYVAILGHNGSGKSTLAKLLNLILTPTSGRIRIDGMDITAPDLSEDDLYALRRKVGMVFQNPDNQLVATIVEEDVAFGPENLGLPQEEIRRRVDEALATVGMSEYADHEPHRLSGGQKQRIAIAGIIAMLPECMIFDESTAMLDPVGRKDVLKTIEKLNREKGITVLTITHYMNEAAKADRVIVLDDGKILAEGTPAEIFAKPELLRSAGLDVPQCSALVEGLRDAGFALAGDCYSPTLCADVICRYLEEKRS